VIALVAAPRLWNSSKRFRALRRGAFFLINFLSKLTILGVDRDGPEYSTSYRRIFPHSFAPAPFGGGLGGVWALVCEGSNPSPSAHISPELSTLLNRRSTGPGGCVYAVKTYVRVAARVGTIVPKGPPRARLAGRFGYKHNEDPGARG
jgi:hypothetical protein